MLKRLSGLFLGDELPALKEHLIEISLAMDREEAESGGMPRVKQQVSGRVRNRTRNPIYKSSVPLT